MSDNINQTTAERAADKLHKEAEEVSKLKGSDFKQIALRTLAGPICFMLVKFCYQDETFAELVLQKKEKLFDCLTAILKLETKEKPLVSDLDAYAEAVRFYVPEGKVTMSCRVVMPVADDDLLDLGIDTEDVGGAIILDFLLSED